MKKLVLALSTATIFALTACGGEKPVEVNQPAQPQVEEAAPAVENAAPAVENAAEQAAQEQAPVQEPAAATPAQEEAPAKTKKSSKK